MTTLTKDGLHSSGVTIIGAKDLGGKPFGFTINTQGFITKTYHTPAEWSHLENHPRMLPLLKPATPNNLAHENSLDLRALPTGSVLDAKDQVIVPAGIDAHIHSRDPGLTHKEDWQTLRAGAAKGGVVAVCDMPNTIPPTLFRENVVEKAEIAARSGLCFQLILGVSAKNINLVSSLLKDPTLPISALKVFYGKTTGELLYDDLETLARHLPEDGKKLVVFHSEDQCQVDCNEKNFKHLLYLEDPQAFEVHSKIRSSEAAHASTRTILDWALQSYKRPVHIAHVSTPIEIELIADYKSRGTQCTSEVAPHHLIFTTEDYGRYGALVKMNPPLRSPAEVEALRRLVAQGAVDMFATDHAPHTLAEKKNSVARAPSGVPALEFFWPLVLECARLCQIPLNGSHLDHSLLLSMAAENPARLFNFAQRGRLTPGYRADFAILTSNSYLVSSENVVSKCGWSPYAGMMLPRGVAATFWSGQMVFDQATSPESIE
jgi:dihydroorotase